MTVWSTAPPLAWLLIACVSVLGGDAIVGAQTLPSEPLTLADGHVTVAGDVSASVGPSDLGFFNYTDYEHSALRLLRIDVSAAAKAGPHFTILGEVRSENANSLRPYALYLRIRPWTARNFDIQVGLVPPTFGAFARRTYASDNPLIGYPLAYQYLTSLRADALPANADELLKMRGRGWLSNYSVGNLTPDRGVPLVSAFRWDTGVQVHTEHGIFDATAAVTAGTVSDPLVSDNNSGRQIAGRVTARPVAGLIIGTSAAHGPFVSTAAAKSAGVISEANDFTQTAWGADVEYSRGYYLLRAETILSWWTLPALEAPFIPGPLRAASISVEGRYKILPGLYAAGRLEHLGFNPIAGTDRTDSWEAPLTRFEIGAGYSLQRNLLVKLAVQRDTREGGRVTSQTLPAAQLVFWF